MSRNRRKGSDLTNPASVEALLRRRGLQPNRRRGQNFLTDAGFLDAAIAAAGLAPGGSVMEVGPGLGALTRALAGAVGTSGRVLALEVDKGLYQALTEETLLQLDQVHVELADAMQADLNDLVPRYLGSGRVPVVANIPYSITSPLIARLLEHAHLFSVLVLMVQKEVGLRVTASPGGGSYGSLTLFVNLYAEADLVAEVPRTAFFPAPDVDSALIRMRVREAPAYPDLDPERYLRVVHAAFQMRRKNLANALCGPSLGWSRDEAVRSLSAAGIDWARRGETLSPNEFAELTRHWPEGTDGDRPTPPKLDQAATE